MSPCQCLHVSEIPQTENGTNGKTAAVCSLPMENGNSQLPFVAENGNGKLAVFYWSANDKQ
jgi:hypothetical protein